jgi:hypothetical protein
MSALLALVCAMTQQQSSPSFGVPAVTLSGPDGHFAKASIRLIQDESAWKAWWAEMKGLRLNRLGPNDPPTVDFKIYWVVAVAQGPSVNSMGVRFPETVFSGGALLVRFDDKSFQSGKRGVPLTCPQE